MTPSALPQCSFIDYDAAVVQALLRSAGIPPFETDRTPQRCNPELAMVLGGRAHEIAG